MLLSCDWLHWLRIEPGSVYFLLQLHVSGALPGIWRFSGLITGWDTQFRSASVSFSHLAFLPSSSPFCCLWTFQGGVWENKGDVRDRRGLTWQHDFGLMLLWPACASKASHSRRATVGSLMILPQINPTDSLTWVTVFFLKIPLGLLHFLDMSPASFCEDIWPMKILSLAPSWGQCSLLPGSPCPCLPLRCTDPSSLYF